MNDIRCRGLLNNGKWAYGYYFETADRRYKMIVNYPDTESKRPRINPIRPGTLGMFSGCFDCMGAPIYDGDILKIGKVVFKVEYQRGAFVTVSITGKKLMEKTVLSNWEEHLILIIGNIFEGINELF